MFYHYKNTAVFYKILTPRDSIFAAQKSADNNERHKGNYIVFLPGWGAPHTVYSAIYTPLQRQNFIVLIDFPPFGLSESPEGVWTVRDYACLTAEIIKDCGISRCSLFCHSFGARVAAYLCGGEVAAQMGITVEKLLITGGAGLKPRFTIKKFLSKTRYRAYKRLAKAGLIDARRLDSFFSSDYRALPFSMRQTFKNIVGQDLKEFFSRIQQDTLLLYGKNDRDTPIYMGKKLNKMIINSALIELSGGHYCFADDFNKFYAATEKFFLS